MTIPSPPGDTGEEEEGEAATDFLPLSEDLQSTGKEEKLTAAEIKELKKFMNPTYLDRRSMEDVNKQFCEHSSLQLDGFLRGDLARSILRGCLATDGAEAVGGRRPQLDHAVGLSFRLDDDAAGSGWRLVGPPHKQRYLRFESATAIPFINSQASEKGIPLRTGGTAQASSANSRREEVGEKLSQVLTGLFSSKVFAKYLRIVTSLCPTAVRGEVRRFRAGLVRVIPQVCSAPHYMPISRTTQSRITAS